MIVSSTSVLFLGLEIGSWAEWVASFMTFVAVCVSLALASRKPSLNLKFEIEIDTSWIFINLKNYSVMPIFLEVLNVKEVKPLNPVIEGRTGTEINKGGLVIKRDLVINGDESNERFKITIRDTISKRKLTLLLNKKCNMLVLYKTFLGINIRKLASLNLDKN